ncbi:MAG: TfoX/Sxy family protein [Egibacteraceae bacterium]
MPHPPPEDIAPQRRFATLVAAFADHPGVSSPDEPGGRGFGSAALKVNGSIFAMLSRGQLVVKLPQHRVQALINDGAGAPFTAGKTIPMRQWVKVPNDTQDILDEDSWLALAREALDFVAHPPRRR